MQFELPALIQDFVDVHDLAILARMQIAEGRFTLPLGSVVSECAGCLVDTVHTRHRLIDPRANLLAMPSNTFMWCTSCHSIWRRTPVWASYAEVAPLPCLVIFILASLTFLAAVTSPSARTISLFLACAS